MISSRKFVSAYWIRANFVGRLFIVGATITGASLVLLTWVSGFGSGNSGFGSGGGGFGSGFSGFGSGGGGTWKNMFPGISVKYLS